MTEQPTFLLVHGSWHGSWCFERLIVAFAARGARAGTVDLPSVGDDPAALGTLADDAAAISSAASTIEGPVAVVAHSYGGAAVSEAVFGPNVEALIFLCAFMPDTGRTYPSYFPPGPLPPYVDLRDDGTMGVTEGLAIPSFYADCTPETQLWAQALLRPQSQAVVGHAITAASWRTLPSAYVVTTHDMALPPDFQRMFAAQATTAYEIVGSHSPFLARPDDLAALLITAANDLTGSAHTGLTPA